MVKERMFLVIPKHQYTAQMNEEITIIGLTRICSSRCTQPGSVSGDEEAV